MLQAMCCLMMQTLDYISKRGASHYNWKIAAQDSTNKGFEISSGAADGDANSDTYTPRLVIEADTGDIGIGTTSPSHRLHVNSGGTNVVGVFESSDSIASIAFKDSATTSASHVNIGADANDMFFVTGGTTKARLSSSGRLGLGSSAVSAPAQLLHVAGTGASVQFGSSGVVTPLIHYGMPTFYGVNSSDDVQNFSFRYGNANSYAFNMHQRVTSGVVRWSLGQRNANVDYNDVLVFHNGNIAIGQQNASDKLDINGSMRISGAYKIGANKVIEQVGTRLNIGDVDNNDYIVDITAYGDTSSIVMNDGFIDVVGDFDIAGALSKNSGSFKIDHPLKPDTHHLVHSFVEGPQADNLYRGVIDLHNGRATIDLDEWFGMTLNRDIQAFVTILGIMSEHSLALNRDIQAFVNNADTWDNVRAKVMGSQLVIECQNPESNAKVSWLVIGERQDKEIHESSLTDDHGKVIVEPEKVG